jgi:transportin-3
MLTVLPEEVFDTHNTDSKLTSATRTQYCREVLFSVFFSLFLFFNRNALALINYFCFTQLLAQTPIVLEFLLQQSEKSFDAAQLHGHERNRKILRCLLSWVWHCFLL